MFRKMNLQTKLNGSFLIMGLLVFFLVLVGWLANYRLSQHIKTLSYNTVPSIMGLWKINEGQTQINVLDRLLLNSFLVENYYQDVMPRLDKAKSQIKEGFDLYEIALKTPDEEVLYRRLLEEWNTWEVTHNEFLQNAISFYQIGQKNPWAKQVELLAQGKGNSPEMAEVKKAIALYEKMADYRGTRKVMRDAVVNSIVELLKINEDVGVEARDAAAADARSASIWSAVWLILGPVTSLVLGVVLTKAIAKPLDEAIKGIVNTIAGSSTEIAATIEQQERIASDQAASVNETSSTIDELGASSRQSAAQAKAGAENARQVLRMAEAGITGAREVLQMAKAGAEGSREVLNLAESGMGVVGKTLEGISTLQQKVSQLSEQISRLSQQVTQIGSITNLVQNIANQTNMLALNASVEAVRAGEHGKGFAVVAAEIRKLADQSRGSAEKISVLVADIHNAIGATFTLAEESRKNASQTIELSQQTAAAFSSVNQAINTIVLKNQELTVNAMSDIVLKNQELTITAINDAVLTNQQIALTAGQQSIAVEQVVNSINSINSGAQQTAAGITQTKIGIQKLNEAALQLKALGGK
ncbi:MAG TPA: MCP four helix bundle domain-containing protein [Oscillatoriaceae cyanobacterium M33_DOE_052]|uniref:Chemotaxis protein n=1 Tax=Planktothricoides sp. SpSt-374 TaxID=2282167 RepID=A0A7C3ZFD4_9CYAN|nr:MCP four helix bundle domain-containing protein [Oscillatoriaceae cyanobacterium M33_DOE_052]